MARGKNVNNLTSKPRRAAPINIDFKAKSSDGKIVGTLLDIAKLEITLDLTLNRQEYDMLIYAVRSAPWFDRDGL